MRKWLSRGIVLAMVVALMVPMPAMAKSKSSKSGGKLLKSVTVYEAEDAYSEQNARWRVDSKISYTYDKKNNPSKKTTTNYYSYFGVIPMRGSTSTTTFKYKYKGKKAKSMTEKDDAGFIVGQYTYKNGKRASYSKTDAETYRNTAVTPAVDVESKVIESGSIAYDGNGNVVGSCYVESGQNPWYVTDYDWNRDVVNSYRESNSVYSVTLNKGLPSYIVEASNGKWSASHTDGTVTGDTWGSTDGTADYESYNDKGLATQYGWYDGTEKKYNASQTVEYKMNKGVVTEAIVFNVDYETGKQTAVRKYEFKYNKTKISKTRYMNMINSFTSGMGCFFWY